MRFSERFGYRKVRDLVQIESMDEELRNGLWNVLSNQIWQQPRRPSGVGEIYLEQYPWLRDLCSRLWIHHFKRRIDERPSTWSRCLTQLREHFFGCDWFEVYDFLEFIAANYPFDFERDDFIQFCNLILEREVSAYRFVDGTLARITELIEVESIESALDEELGPAATHIRRALELLSDRKDPDFRNSIKESISAVESLVQTRLGMKGTLGRLLNELERKHGVHPSLTGAFSKLYGYTSDGGGIRHAILDSTATTSRDAKFFLVVCSAFVNYMAEQSTAPDQDSVSQ